MSESAFAPPRRPPRRPFVRAAIALLVALVLARLLWPPQGRELGASSFGTGPTGHGALLDLLHALELTHGRSFAPPARLPAGATVWWIEPRDVCDAWRALRGDPGALDLGETAWPGLDWVEGGGTAVVWLGPSGGIAGRAEGEEEGEDAGGVALGAGGEEPPPCRRIGAVEVPPRRALPPADAHGVAGLGGGGDRRLPLERPFVFERAIPDADRLPVAAPARRFAGAEGDLAGFEVTATLGGHPFVLARSVGEGRLLLVADARFVRNAWLDRADAAPVAVALATRFGTPWIDERGHGFVPEANPLRYVARSPAAPVFLGLLVAGVLFAWRGSTLPARSVAELDPATPTLETFVASMAAHYAGTRDWERLALRYRELTAARLRRHLGQAGASSPRALAERVEHGFGARRGEAGRRVREGLRALGTPPPVGGREELAAHMRALDGLVEEVTRG